MPLCPQIANSPIITVTQTADFTVTSVVPVVPADTQDVAAVDANAAAAQATATTALADAVIAFNAAKASLQPSASTIVNATNQITAIATNGITVYSGASASSGARVVMNSLGLAGFNASNVATFSISATTGAAVFSGSVTGATITGSDLNIAGVFLVNGTTGVMTATSATITGTVNATAGYLGSPSSGWNFSASGFLTNNGGSTILYPTTTPGGNANTYALFTDRGVYAERIFSTGTQASSIFSLGGLSVDGQVSGAAGSFVVNSSGNMTTVGAITSTGAITTSGNISTSGSGTITSAGAINGTRITSTDKVFAGGFATTANTANTHMFSNGELLRNSASSQRYKENIVNLNSVPELNAKKLLDLPIRAFSYKEGHLDSNDDRYMTLIPGFIAEEVDAIYPIGADYDDGPENWNERIIIPGMLALIQDLYKEIALLKGE